MAPRLKVVRAPRLDFPVVMVGQSSQSILFKPIRPIIILTILRFLSPLGGDFAAIIAKF
jgi:hypothetical protein